MSGKENKKKNGRKKRKPDMDLGLDLTKTHVKQKMKDVETCNAEPVERPETEEEKQKDKKKLALLLIGIIAIFGIIFAVIYLTNQEAEPVTIEGLHEKNLAGELGPEQGYLYNGYSFVKYADVWYTQLEKGSTIYDVTFNYDPKKIEDIPVEGLLTENFVKDGKLYVTFDPEGKDLKYVAVANYGLSRSLARAFGYEMKAGCTKNVTAACGKARLVECGDPDKAVIYFKEAEDARVILADNCVIVQGEGEEIVKAKDRLLLRWYGITDEQMPQQKG